MKIILGFSVLILWSLFTICAVDIFLYTVVFMVLNFAYMCHLIKKHFPVYIPPYQRELYHKVFKPLQVSKKVSLHCITNSSRCPTSSIPLFYRISDYLWRTARRSRYARESRSPRRTRLTSRTSWGSCSRGSWRSNVTTSSYTLCSRWNSWTL